MFQTFADYDKWRRRQLLMRLEKLQQLPMRPDTIVRQAEKAGDPMIKAGSRPSAGLTSGIARSPMKSAPLSTGLKKGLLSPSYFNGMVSPALRRILRQRIIDFNETGVLPTITGPGPNSRGSDVNMITHDGVYYAERDAQLTGLPSGSGVDGFTFSVFITLASQKTAVANLLDGSAANREENLRWNADGSITIIGDDWLGSNYGSDTTATNILTPGTRSHLMWSVSRASNKNQLWIDGSLVVDTTYDTANDPLGNETDWHICASRTATNLMDNGDKIGAFWIGNEYVSTPIGAFIQAEQADPTPLEHGDDGSTPTGTQPLVFFNTTTDWNAGTNQGTGGNFVVKAGTVT
jgi:hypothetical protein